MLPKQKISLNDKLRRDETTGKTWGEETIDHYIEQFMFSPEREEMIKLQRAVNGLIDGEEYDYLLNPLNIKQTNKLNYSARLRDYNILRGIANLMMGEYGRRTHEYTVTDFNPDDDSRYKEALRKSMKSYFSQLAVNTLNEQGFPTGKQSQELPSYEEHLEKFKRTFDQNRVITGQEALDYIRYDADIDDLILDLYWDWLVVGRCFSYKEVRHDDVHYSHVPALEMHVPIEGHSKYAEDWSYAVRRRVVSINHLVDLMRDEITAEELDRLEDEADTAITGLGRATSTGVGGFIKLDNIYDGVDNYYFSADEVANGVELFHVVWTAYKRVGTLYYKDPLGMERTMDVDETYTLNKDNGDIRIEWEWINDTWEGWRAKDYYYGVKSLETNRADLNNDSIQKHGYNGIVSRSAEGEINSIIKEGLPYQILINGLHYQVEKIINKNKDKLLVMPYGLVPRKKGMGTKQQMYHADSTSILWVDETAPNAQFAAQMIKSLDMSLGTYIKDTIEIMKYIKSEYWDAIGMNAQRYSDIAQGAGKGTTEQAIIRSSIITYEMNRRMDKLIEKDYQGLLDISKFAWINGKKAKYIRTDGAEAFLNLSPDDAIYHSETDYGIFVRNSQEMSEAIQQYRQLALAFAQNGGGMGGMAELFTNNNMEKLKDIVQKIEDNNKKHEEVIAENAHKRKMEELTKQEETAEKDRDVKRYEADKRYEGQVHSADIRSSNSRAQEPKPENSTERRLAEHKIQKENKEVDIKQQQVQTKNTTKDE